LFFCLEMSPSANSVDEGEVKRAHPVARFLES